MRRVFVAPVLLVTALFAFGSSSSGQGRAKTGPDPSLIRDSELEKDSLHNLEVARHYFKQKKAYLAALKRCEEIDAGNPTFSKMDEVLFLAGESSLRLAETGGQQKTKKVIPTDAETKEGQVTRYKTPDDLRVDARVYFSRLVTEFPNSSFYQQAETELQTLGGPIKPEGAKP